jgi:carboxypeptidase Q
MRRRDFLCAPPALSAVLLRAQPDVASRILGAALTDEVGWRRLEHLCYRIGHRLGGSQSLQQAVEWAAEQMRSDGHENGRLLPAKVRHWVRGAESALLLAPTPRALPMLGLGDSVGTPAAGVEAELVVVSTFDQLRALGAAGVGGKIVLYNVPFTTYGATVKYRSAGASEAAKLGAVAALVRSVTPHSLGTPHTGALGYQDDAPKIPAAAITVEDAERLDWLYRAGETVRVKLVMGARMLAAADSANPMAEIVGRERPQEIVVLGGHIDSWDVGQGAHDDGAACVAAMTALGVIRRLGLRPRRTLRVALWTNEENGLGGSRAYREWIGDGISNHVAAIEMDSGCERPTGFGFSAPKGDDSRAAGGLELARRLVAPLEAINAANVSEGGGGADISNLIRGGVPGFGLQTVEEHYFDWHHTEADTLDKIDPVNFHRSVAALAVLAYGLGEMEQRI